MKKTCSVFLCGVALLVWTGMGAAQEQTDFQKLYDLEADGLILTQDQGSEIDSNTYYGLNAGDSSTGNQNSFFGAWAGQNNAASGNTCVGYNAGHGNTGTSLVSFGYYAGWVNEGANNTFIGTSSGNNNTTGHDNTFLGRLSGRSNVSGSNNTAVGSFAGYSNQTGQGNVFLGYMAGYDETGSNKLYIDNSDTAAPLIYGDFSSNTAAINGKLGVGTQTVPVKFTVVDNGTTEATSFANYSALFFNSGSAYFGFRNTTDNAEGFFGVGGGSGARFGMGTVTNHAVEFFANNGVRMLLNANGSLQMTSGAQCTTAGVWQNASSRDYKKDIHEITPEDAADALNALNPVRFRYKSDADQEEYLGFIAEDVPDLVATQDRKSMSPMDVVAVLTKVLKEQQKTISELSRKVSKLESRN